MIKKITQKVFDYFKEKNFEEEAFSIMIVINLVSVCIAIGYRSEFGVTLQQGLSYLGQYGVKILNVIARFDASAPGVLTIIGALIGFIGIILVIYIQGNYQYKQDKKRLMLMLLSIYEELYYFYYIIGDWKDNEMLSCYRLSSESFKKAYPNESVAKWKYESDFFESIYDKIIYDKEWRRLIVTLKDYNELNFLRELFLSIEIFYIYNEKKADEDLKNIRKILKNHKYRRKLKMIDKKLLIDKEEYRLKQEAMQSNIA